MVVAQSPRERYSVARRVPGGYFFRVWMISSCSSVRSQRQACVSDTPRSGPAVWPSQVESVAAVRSLKFSAETGQERASGALAVFLDRYLRRRGRTCPVEDRLHGRAVGNTGLLPREDEVLPRLREVGVPPAGEGLRQFPPPFEVGLKEADVPRAQPGQGRHELELPSHVEESPSSRPGFGRERVDDGLLDRGLRAQGQTRASAKRTNRDGGRPARLGGSAGLAGGRTCLTRGRQASRSRGSPPSSSHGQRRGHERAVCQRIRGDDRDVAGRKIGRRGCQSALQNPH